MRRARIVVLAHATDRTGPPVYLLQVLRRLDRSQLDVTVVALRGGELLGELQALAEVRVVGEPVDVERATARRVAEEPDRLAARRAQLADLVDLDLVVVNTAWSIHALDWLPAGSHRVVSIVHELAAGVGDLLPARQLERLLASERFVVGCTAVDDLLQRHHGVPAPRIERIPYGVDLDAPPGGPDDRGPLEAAPTDLVVVAAAVPDRRKGPDLFVHLAATARRMRPDVPWAFRWIGADPDDPRLGDARRDRALLGVEDLVAFLPSTPHLRAHLAQADAFVLTSRQDAFPLVAIEAALAELPIACFDTGGTRELVGPDAGAVVPYPDLEAVAAALARWHDDPAGRAAAGAAGAARARTDHDVATHAERLQAVLVAEARAARGPDR